MKNAQKKFNLNFATNELFRINNSFRKVVLAASFCLLGSLGAKSQNLLSNASFEEARASSPFVPPTGGFIILTSASVPMPNWVVAAGPHVDWHEQTHGGMGCPPPPGGGVNHIDLNANGRIEQSGFSLLPSTSYRFSYYSSIHSGFGGGGTADATIEISDGTTTFFNDFPSKTSADVGVWTQSFFTFMTPSSISSGSEVLSAFGTGTTGYSNGGVLIDSFVLEEIPCNIDFTLCKNSKSRNQIDVTLNSPDPGSYYEIDFGDGAGWEPFTSTHVYSAKGTYNICIRERKGNYINCERCMEICINEIDVVLRPIAPIKTSKLSNSMPNELNFSLVPNPASSNTTLILDAKKDGTVEVEVTDMTGKVVINKTVHPMLSGRNSVELNTAQLSSGLYNVQIIMEGTKSTERLSVLK